MKPFARVLLFNIVFTLGLHALSLKANYYTPTKEIYLHTIIKNAKTDPLLYTITEGRYTKRVSVKQLSLKLKELGYNVTQSSSNYVKFTHEIAFKKAPLKTFLTKVYKTFYKDITINKITIHARGHLKEMPQNYIPHIRSKAPLKDHGIFSIKADKKEYYFNYTIDAYVKVFLAKNKIKRAQELSLLNLQPKRVKLEHFFAKPLYIEKGRNYESKHNIKKGAIVTIRDVTRERLVRRGETIKVTLQESNLSISFSAKALSNALYGDIIKVKRSNGRILQVKVVGKNRAQLL